MDNFRVCAKKQNHFSVQRLTTLVVPPNAVRFFCFVLLVMRTGKDAVITYIRFQKPVMMKSRQLVPSYQRRVSLVVYRLSGASHPLPPHCDMDSCSSEEFYQAVHHAEQTFRKMESYLKQQQLCDVILIAGNRKIPAHRQDVSMRY